MMTKIEERLYETIFTNDKQMLLPEINSVDLHAMTHEDTEILGMFCDFSGIHGEDLKKLLIRGYLKDVKYSDEGQEIKTAIRYGMGYEYEDCYCPSCNNFICYEPEREKYLKYMKYCYTCGAKLKWQ